MPRGLIYLAMIESGFNPSARSRVSATGLWQFMSATARQYGLRVNRRTDDPHRYLIGPDDLRRLEAELRADGLEIVGYYHSHPDHPAVPSAYDTAHAWPWYSYLIVRIEQGRAREAASYTLDLDRPLLHPESLEVLSEV